MTLHEVYDISTKLGFNAFYCNGNTGVLVYPANPTSCGWCVNAIYSTMVLVENPQAVAHKTRTVLSWRKKTTIPLNNITATEFENRMNQILLNLNFALKQIQLSKNLNKINKDFK
jgi:hypothetical protein